MSNLRKRACGICGNIFEASNARKFCGKECLSVALKKSARRTGIEKTIKTYLDKKAENYVFTVRDIHNLHYWYITERDAEFYAFIDEALHHFSKPSWNRWWYLDHPDDSTWVTRSKPASDRPKGYRPNRNTCDVYLIAMADTRLIKIGSAIDPPKRLRDLQVGCPLPLWLLGRIPEGGTRLECALHDQFRSWRRQGEWFELSARQIAEIPDLIIGEAVHPIG